MKIWHFLQSALQSKKRTVLLYVLDNSGSSPGRKGFKMAVDESGAFIGTIGGGIMEVKLLELAKNKLVKNDFNAVIKQQFHDKKHSNNQSGLICSGEQTVAIIPLENKDLPLVTTIVQAKHRNLKIGITDTGLEVILDDQKEGSYMAVFELKSRKRVHVFGAGHVGSALTEVLSLLDYYIILYDNRPDLGGFKENQFANEIHVVEYENILDFCSTKIEDTVIIVTSSYRSDKSILKQLYQKELFYIGMMGSDAKIANLLEELENEGIPKNTLSHVVAPIGIQILSKTAMEIAVSIVAELIMERNRNLPTGRRKRKNNPSKNQN